MPTPSETRHDTFAAAPFRRLEKSGLTPTEASVLRRVRENDRGPGCTLTVAQLGQASEFRPLGRRQVSRAVAALLLKGYLADLGRAPGRYSPRILTVLPRRDVPAASSQHNPQSQDPQ